MNLLVIFYRPDVPSTSGIFIFMTSGIYKIHWPNNNYFYIGQAQNLKKREREHNNRLKIGKHENYKMQNVYKKHGPHIFTVLEYLPVEQLTKSEENLLSIYFGTKYCCNLVNCARGSRGRLMTDELRKKLSDARKYLTEESRKNISMAQMGKVNSKESNEKRRQSMLNVSDEYKNKMRDIKTGTYTGSQNHSSKIVLDNSTGIFYDCLKEASNISPYKYGYLKMMLSGRSRNKTTLIYC